MPTLTKANIIIDETTRWAARRPDILALGLAGSWAWQGNRTFGIMWRKPLNQTAAFFQGGREVLRIAARNAGVAKW